MRLFSHKSNKSADKLLISFGFSGIIILYKYTIILFNIYRKKMFINVKNL